MALGAESRTGAADLPGSRRCCWDLSGGIGGFVDRNGAGRDARSAAGRRDRSCPCRCSPLWAVGHFHRDSRWLASYFPARRAARLDPVRHFPGDLNHVENGSSQQELPASRPNGQGPGRGDGPYRQGRFRLRRRPQRKRQEHAAADARRDALAHVRARAAGRPVDLRSDFRRSGPAAEGEHRLRLSDVQSRALPDGAGKRPGAAATWPGRTSKTQKETATALLGARGTRRPPGPQAAPN